MATDDEVSSPTSGSSVPSHPSRRIAADCESSVPSQPSGRIVADRENSVPSKRASHSSQSFSRFKDISDGYSFATS